MTYTTKDSGIRAEYVSGMVRDTESGKPRFDLLLPLGVPYAEQMLTRDAMLMARGAEKYDARNWELATGEAELARYRSSAHRHLMQWIAGETDEDHAAAVRFNIMAGEYVMRKLSKPVAPALKQADNFARLAEAAGAKFLCGHTYGEEPTAHCGTAVHWSRVNGIEFMSASDQDCNCPQDWDSHSRDCPYFQS